MLWRLTGPGGAGGGGFVEYCVGTGKFIGRG
jgi:hypothetical protein